MYLPRLSKFRNYFHQPGLYIFLFSLFLFGLFSHTRFYGYEKETWEAAWLFVKNGEFNASRAGWLHSFSYIPWVYFKLLFDKLNIATLSAIFPSTAVAFYSALAPVVFYKIAWLIYQSKKIAVLLSLILAGATMLLPYSIIGMEHFLTLTFAALVYYLVKYAKEHRQSDLIWIGFWLGACYAVKAYAGILMPAVLISLLHLEFNVYKLSFSDFLKRIPAFAAPIIFFIIISVFYNFIRFGNAVAGKYSLAWEFQYDSFWLGLYGYLFSAGKSVFIYNPILILSVFYYRKFFKQYRQYSYLFILLIVFFLMPQLPFRFWTDEAWGPRKLLPLIPLLILPLGIGLQSQLLRSAISKVFFYGQLAASFIMQVLGSLYDYGTQMRVLRQTNLDSIHLMQFMPRLSHFVIHYTLFKSYLWQILGHAPLEFTYNIWTWMRGLAGGQDIGLIGGTLSLTLKWARPHLWILNPKNPMSNLSYSLEWIIFFFFIFMIIFSLIKLKRLCKETENYQ